MIKYGVDAYNYIYFDTLDELEEYSKNNIVWSKFKIELLEEYCGKFNVIKKCDLDTNIVKYICRNNLFSYYILEDGIWTSVPEYGNVEDMYKSLEGSEEYGRTR